MRKGKYVNILVVVFFLSLVRTFWNNDGISLTNMITEINSLASKRTPFKRRKELTIVAKKISDLQKKLIGHQHPKYQISDNKIVNRQQKITNQLIKYKKVLCNNTTSNFGLTILPSDIQLDIKGSNLPQPNFPLYVTSKGKKTHFQLIVTAYEDIKNIEIEFYNSNDRLIECYLGDYVLCTPSPYFNETKWYQDPLFPFIKKNNKFKISRNFKPLKKNDSYPIWVSIKQNTDELTLNCKVTVSGQSKSSFQTKITIKKILHKRKNLDIIVLNSFNHAWTNIYYQDSNLVKKNRFYNNQFLTKYNLDPTLLYTANKANDLFPKIQDNIDNKGPIVIYNFQNFKEIYNDSTKQKETLKTIKKREQYLTSINQIKNSYVYLFDELPENQNYKLVWVSNWLKKNDVKSKLLTTSSYLSGNENIDIWCVLLQDYETLKNKFKGEMWVYICNTTAPPLPNFLIENDKKGFDKLYTFFETRPRIKGLLYYATNNWRGNMINHEKTFAPISQRNKEIMINRNKNLRWPDIEWISYSYKNFNGDGYLFYPNKNGRFIPSVRLFLYENLLLDLKKSILLHKTE